MALMPGEMDRCDSQQFETGVGRIGEMEVRISMILSCDHDLNAYDRPRTTLLLVS